MKPKEFEKLLTRDLGRCLHCGISDDTLVVQHRINRGMGGGVSKTKRPSNYALLCSLANGLIESDPDSQQEAYLYGWKLASWQNPLEEPVYDKFSGEWFLLGDDYSRRLYKKELPA